MRVNMGGEHQLTFHDHNYRNNPCDYIDHENNYEIKWTYRDQHVWNKISKEIIYLIKLCYCHSNFICGPANIHELINDLRIKLETKFKQPWHQFRLFFYYRDEKLIYNLYHDIAKLLILAYPGKLCFCFDRCNLHQEFNQEWDMCSSTYHNYNNIIPNFKFYRVRDLEYHKTIKNKQISCGKLVHESLHLKKLFSVEYEFNLGIILL